MKYTFLTNFYKVFIFYYLFSDRIRTVVNVFGDCVGAAIVHHLNKDRLIQKPQPCYDAV